MDKISANITEIPEKISANISEPTVETGGATYEMDFGTDLNTIWAFYSKNFGNITEVELINIDSYTIDGVAESLPFAIVLDKTYLIDIVKTNPLLVASIKFIVKQSTYDEIQNVIDSSLGDGHYNYALSGVANEVYKLDNTLATIVNYAGAGVFTIPILDTTISLPALPANGIFTQFTFLKDGKMLIAGGNSGSTEKYFCLLDSSNNITDLTGTPNAYTTGTGLNGQILFGNYYNYMDNIIYYIDAPAGRYAVKLDLNTNITTLLENNALRQPSSSISRNKNFFNPYKKLFIAKPEVDFENSKIGRFITFQADVDFKCAFNRNTGYYIRSYNNNYMTVQEFDEYSNTVNSYTSSGGPGYPFSFNTMLDHEKNIAIFCASNNGYNILRLSDNNKKAFLLADPEALETYMIDGMYAYNDLHIGLSSKFGRLHFIDTSDPEGGLVQPDFAYYDLPNICNAMHTNRML